MGIRLNKVITELNIGLQTAVEYLKLHHIGEVKADANPNIISVPKGGLKMR